MALFTFYSPNCAIFEKVKKLRERACRRFDRSVSWVPRRLALAELLTAAAK
jgi:hypothetical protein